MLFGLVNEGIAIQVPVASLPMMRTSVCSPMYLLLDLGGAPSFRRIRSMSFLSPVRKYQPRLILKWRAYFLRTLGGSVTGSKLIESMKISRPRCLPRTFCTLARLEGARGQRLSQLVNMKLIITTLPFIKSYLKRT